MYEVPPVVLTAVAGAVSRILAEEPEKATDIGAIAVYLGYSEMWHEPNGTTAMKILDRYRAKPHTWVPAVAHAWNDAVEGECDGCEDSSDCAYGAKCGYIAPNTLVSCVNCALPTNLALGGEATDTHSGVGCLGCEAFADVADEDL